MLPSLSNKVKLQLLVPVCIEPAWISARRQALLELKTIVDIRVTGRTGKGCSARYTIEVFRNSMDNESPTSVEPIATGGRPLKAALKMEKTLAELALLRVTFMTPRGQLTAMRTASFAPSSSSSTCWAARTRRR